MRRPSTIRTTTHCFSDPAACPGADASAAASLGLSKEDSDLVELVELGKPRIEVAWQTNPAFSENMWEGWFVGRCFALAPAAPGV